MALVKFTPTGQVDPDFAPRVYPLDLGGDFSDQATALSVDASGRILLAGRVSKAAGNHDYAVLRLLPDGTPDPHFGSGGLVVTNSAVLFATDMDDTGVTLVRDADDHIILVGTTSYDASDTYRQTFGIVRLIGDTIFADGAGG